MGLIIGGILSYMVYDALFSPNTSFEQQEEVEVKLPDGYGENDTVSEDE